MPQKKIAVIASGRTIATFTTKEAKERGLEVGKRYDVVPQDEEDDVTVTFVENPQGPCEVSKQ